MKRRFRRSFAPAALSSGPRVGLRPGLCAGLCVALLAGLAGCSAAPDLPPLTEAAAPGGDYLRTLDHGGLGRHYVLHVPKAAGAGPKPLVIVLHGAFNTALGIAEDSGFSSLADRAGFYVAYPEGIGLKGKFQHWNAGICCGKAKRKEVDDVGFVGAVLEDVAGRFPVDRQKVYLVGMSNGGMLAYLYAGRHGEQLAGLAVVAGTAGGRTEEGELWTVPKPAAPMPLVVVHGTDDGRIPHGSQGEEREILSAAGSAAFYVEANRCAPEPREEELAGGRVEKRTWVACSQGSDVVFFSVKDWGHDWPGGPKASEIGGFDAAAEIWNLLRRERRWQLFDKG